MDIENHDELIQYLADYGHLQERQIDHIQPLSGGVSNRTMLVGFGDSSAWVIKQALEKLRVTSDWFSDPIRIHREAAGIRTLQQLTSNGTIPAFVFEDHQHHLLAMNAVPQPHENWKTLLLQGDLNLDYIRQFGLVLASIHRNAYQERDTLALEFADSSFFESLRLEPYYAYSAEQIPTLAPFLTQLIATTKDTQITLVHGDYSPKNVLIYQDQVVLLDHEVIHWGDPAFDIGFSLTHLLSKAHHLSAYRSQFTQAAHTYWQTYAEGVHDMPWRNETERRAIQHTLACLLARVMGRSPLEYLTSTEKQRQQQAVMNCVESLHTIMTIPDLIDLFIDTLDTL